MNFWQKKSFSNPLWNTIDNENAHFTWHNGIAGITQVYCTHFNFIEISSENWLAYKIPNPRDTHLSAWGGRFSPFLLLWTSFPRYYGTNVSLSLIQLTRWCSLLHWINSNKRETQMTILLLLLLTRDSI